MDQLPPRHLLQPRALHVIGNQALLSELQRLIGATQWDNLHTIDIESLPDPLWKSGLSKRLEKPADHTQLMILSHELGPRELTLTLMGLEMGYQTYFVAPDLNIIHGSSVARLRQMSAITIQLADAAAELMLFK